MQVQSRWSCGKRRRLGISSGRSERVTAGPCRPAGSSTNPSEREGTKKSNNASGFGEGAAGTAEAEGDEGEDKGDEEILNFDP